MRVIDYIEELQTSGKLWFTFDEALAAVGCSRVGLKRSLDKLKQKKRVVTIRGFILIVPVEYKDWGVVPADWFIDPLMKAFGLPYYVSLLSAAQFHGSAHQRPMQFQVMTNKPLRDIKRGRVYIKFVPSVNVAEVPTQVVQVKTGYAVISTPETTVFDLCKNYKCSGYWSNVATVISELLEHIDVEKLCSLAASEVYDLTVLQRLGAILSLSEVGGELISEKLFYVAKNYDFRWISLNPSESGANMSFGVKDNRWKVIINENVEIDS